MASKYEYFYSGVTYAPCACCYSERGYYSGNLVSFTRRNKDSATVTISAGTEMTRANVGWSGNGWRYLWQETVVDGNIIGRGTGTQHDNCSANWGNAVSHSGSYSFTQTSNNKNEIRINGRSGYQTGSGEASFYWNVDNGWTELVIPVTNDYKVLPPSGLTGSISVKNSRIIRASCNLSSWSANPHIGGTPYTSGGGRAWNFRAQIKLNGKVIKSIEKNTGEARTASFDFSGLDLKLDTNYTLEFTASNNYQQTVTYQTTFTIEPMGYIVRDNQVKKIKSIAIVNMNELGGDTQYVFNARKIS